MKNNLVFGIIALSAFSLVLRGEAAEVVEHSHGTAKNSKGEIVYLEKHTSRLLGGALQHLETHYFLQKVGGQGVEPGEKFGSIRSDFTRSSFVPNYKFEDQRHHRSAGVEWSGDEIFAFAKTGQNEKPTRKAFKVSQNTVTGQGLHNFLRTHLAEFLKNTDLKKEVQFLIPMNQEQYSFRIRTKNIDQAKNTIQLRIEADSWFFRMLAPHIDVTYDISNQRLLEYQGPSNLLGSDGQKMNVTIGYKYDEV